MPTLIFYAQRNSFTRSFALEAIRKTLMWRINTLRPTLDCSSSVLQPVAHCLPTDARDAFGRPIAVVKVTDYDLDTAEAGDQKPLKTRVYAQMERFRMHLDCLNEENEHMECPVLQYVVLLDLNGLSVQNIVRHFKHPGIVLTTILTLAIRMSTC